MITQAELLATRERKDKAQHRFDELCRHAMKLSVAADLEYEDLLDKYIRQVEDAQ
jgi:hypothetical protein